MDDDNFLDVHALTVGREIHHTKQLGTKVDDDDEINVDNNNNNNNNNNEFGAQQSANKNGDLPTTTAVDKEDRSHACHDHSSPEDERQQTPDSKNEIHEPHLNNRRISSEPASNTVQKMDTMGTNELTVTCDPEAAMSPPNKPSMDQYVDEPYLFDKDMEAWGLSRRKLILAFSILIILIVVALSVTICGIGRICG
jgi:hypothetical protein